MAQISQRALPKTTKQRPLERNAIPGQRVIRAGRSKCSIILRRVSQHVPLGLLRAAPATRRLLSRIPCRILPTCRSCPFKVVTDGRFDRRWGAPCLPACVRVLVRGVCASAWLRGHVRGCACVCACPSVCACARAGVRARVCVCARTCAWVCVCVCVGAFVRARVCWR